MTITDENCVVGIEYEVKEAGTADIVDSNKGSGQPLEFIMGKGQIIPGLEKGLCGMGKDESADLMIPSADAYGEYNPEAIQTLPIDQFEGVELKEGLTLYGQSEDGQTTQVIVKSFTEETVEIDFNHPMAGKDLMFSVTVKDAREATPAEIEAGVVGAGEEAAAGGSCGTGCGCH
ncbi:MAG: FKBP-type peptidyl-prolyl cis-trans isomerase SlyD (EC [uncultured Sulfurovum sp.]|uniref:Peptidyl-prolyl cis-trans isomerase n=1 Tax=uncultured Sulfurovum sp. TaxID=269237 RepID=A0A6S6TJS3_9BACT|nr:MAG: FKBP-type peptidyl-prolyl cis-trans isomerase SlyD (EC [uncultured Sulfurovum sp.]